MRCYGMARDTALGMLLTAVGQAVESLLVSTPPEFECMHSFTEQAHSLFSYYVHGALSIEQYPVALHSDTV